MIENRLRDAVPKQLQEGVGVSPLRDARDIENEVDYDFQFVGSYQLQQFIEEADHAVFVSELTEGLRYRILKHKDAHGNFTGKSTLQMSTIIPRIWNDYAHLFEGGTQDEAKRLVESSGEEVEIVDICSKKKRTEFLHL